VAGGEEGSGEKSKRRGQGSVRGGGWKKGLGRMGLESGRGLEKGWEAGQKR